MIDLAKRGGGDVRRVIPKGFPYFTVEWAGGGFAHVIEDKAKFGAAGFGLGVIASMLGAAAERRAARGDERGGTRRRKAALEFIARFRSTTGRPSSTGEYVG